MDTKNKQRLEYVGRFYYVNKRVNYLQKGQGVPLSKLIKKDKPVLIYN